MLSIVLVWASLGAAVGAASDLLAEAEALLGSGRGVAAYELLAPLESRRAGDTRYDYLLAVAAMASERPAAAVQPLRRVLAVAPRFDGARLELARALQAVGDAQAARDEFAVLAAEGASPLTRELAARGLEALRSPAAVQPRPVNVEVAWLAGAGYDSNANAATTETGFFGFILDPRDRRQASSFAEVGASLRGERVLVPGTLRGSALLRAGHRLNVDARELDQSVVDAGLALDGRWRDWQLGAAAHLTGGLLDGRAHFSAPYVELSASHPGFGSLEWVGLARMLLLDYRQAEFQPLDVRRYVWGGALQSRRRAAGVPSYGVALIGGRDTARDAASPFSNDRYGARLFGALDVGPARAVYGELSWLTSDFYGARGFQGIDRLDRQWVATLGVEARDWPAEGWSTGPQLRFTDNASNVPVFEFDRLEVSVFVRRALR